MSQTTDIGRPDKKIKLEIAAFSAQSLYEKCQALANNLWWSWNPEAINLFRDLNPQLWAESGQNPIKLLKEYTPETLEARAQEITLYSRINQTYRRMNEYLEARTTWGTNYAGPLGAKPVAYFSAEFGIHESLPIYSGGLGVLSGDHVKSASDLGIPLVAVGLFYYQGYFNQRLDTEGYQNQEYFETKIDEQPVEPALDVNGNPVKIEIVTRTGTIFAEVRHIRVGRVDLYLLDSNVEGNSPEDRELTARLYGGDNRTRIRQELLIGIGGVKALNAMGISPGAYHLNEGHSAFAGLEVIRNLMHEDGMTFEDALRDVAKQTVFTTHTPVPAGHDRFDNAMVDEHLGVLADDLGISQHDLMALGRVDPKNDGETFCMTVLALKLSRRANAVSSLHGHVSRAMWAELWPWRVEEEIPIGHITNGVHTSSWIAPQMSNLFERYFPAKWETHLMDSKVWQHVYEIDPGEFWETHQTLKNLMFTFVRRRLVEQCKRRGESQETLDVMARMFDPDVLTLGFARRFATYKRADLVFSDLDRVIDLFCCEDRPVQVIFSGKAHPADEPGKKLIKRIAQLRNHDKLGSKVAFVENYDINVCRHLEQGVDVWLNNPRRPMEASGTSGQKVVLNGGLNLSILDGWWAEAYDGSNGFAIGNGRRHSSDELTDKRDADALYDTLENEVIPMFYDRDSLGLPQDWINCMKRSVGTLAWRFSSDRMVADYVQRAYVPAAGGKSCEMPF
ncbi:Alpha-glucan phosphorylase [Planctomycetales bacterium 10988]|nr:Alpha-glucan phosphorylase [Planctomycetales bacterium 10988]